jgi:histidine triad (HIT) family protein
MIHNSSLELPDDGSCAFCAYMRGQRPYTIVAANEDSAVLVTREQRGTPHLLVVPVRHIGTILDLVNEEATALILGVRQAARAINEAYRRTGIAVWQNNGVSANQTVSHVHFHVAGTLDRGGTDWGEVEELPLKATDAIGERLRPHLHL